MTSSPEQVELIEKWRLRHAYPDAIGMWAASTGEEARSFAFNAIAQDPRVLHRAARLQAVKMATQAEEFALSLTEAAAPWLAAAQFVCRSIETWRHSLRAYERHVDTLGAAHGAPQSARRHLSDPWENARRNFPSVDEETGQLATRILHEFGTVVLDRARKPWDHVIVLAVLRHSAQRLRGILDPAARREAIADALAMQFYAERAGLSPLMVGYSGPGPPAQQALSLLRDARTLLDATGPEHNPWQQAIEFHAYAFVALDHRALLDLPLDEAREIAAAAIRHADCVLQGSDQALLPFLPDGSAPSPHVVKLRAKACLPDQSETMSAPR
jgi:hypothetical protein